MKKTKQVVGILIAAVMLLSMFSTSAEAVLKDFGPLNKYGFPSFYRDNNNVAVQQCLSHAISPVSGLGICNILPNPDSAPPFDATLPITFPPNPATGYNFPDESFYYSISPDPLSFAFAAGRGRVVVVLALEAAFTSGNPIPGDQVVFSRVRVYLTQGVPDGNYKVTHPYGIENLTVTGGLLRFTRDIGITGGIPFAGPLTGDMGPFFTWTVDPALVAAGIQNPDGTINGVDPATNLPGGDVFLGDFNQAHTFTGSPFGTNFFRVDGPVGSGIGGPGIDFIQTDLGLLEGWKYTTPIPTPLTIDRATFKRDAATGQIDLFATSGATSNTGAISSLSVSGINIPTTVMTRNAAGKFFAHLTNTTPGLIPTSVTITNTSDSPPTIVNADLVDEVAVTSALYDPNAQILIISARSGDALTNPSLTVDGFGVIPTPGGTLVIPSVTVPPAKITVLSAARGSNSSPVLVRGTTPPVAVNDTVALVNGTSGTSVAIDVLANDRFITPASTLDRTTLAVVAQPTNGTATVDPIAGTISYLPNSIAFSGIDSFSYQVKDNNGIFSNIATVTVTVTLSTKPPLANNDTASSFGTQPVMIPILANDVSYRGTGLDPQSIINTSPTLGSVIADGLGGMIYFPPVPSVSSTVMTTFYYQVKDVGGNATSNTATVTIAVNPTPLPPIAVNDTLATQKNVAILNVNLTTNDVAVSNPLDPASVTIISPPASGTLLNNSNGTVSFTPALDFTGVVSFTYTVNDTQNLTSNAATATITVVAVNAAPIAGNDVVSTNQNTPITINVIANDTDADGTINPASVVILTAPANGTAVNNGNGTITYTPATNVTGDVSFSYTVRDNLNLVSNSATVSITVLVVNQLPVAGNDTATVISGTGPVSISVLANDSDVDGTINSASVVIANQSLNGTAVANPNGTIAFTPTAGFSGITTFTYNVKDNLGATSNNATVTVNVTAAITENILITRSEFRVNGSTWRIDGTTTARILGETVMVFNAGTVPADLTTNLLGSATVDVNGIWAFQARGSVIAPNNLRSVSIRTSLGTVVENITLIVR